MAAPRINVDTKTCGGCFHPASFERSASLKSTICVHESEDVALNPKEIDTDAVNRRRAQSDDPSFVEPPDKSLTNSSVSYVSAFNLPTVYVTNVNKGDNDSHISGNKSKYSKPKIFIRNQKGTKEISLNQVANAVDLAQNGQDYTPIHYQNSEWNLVKISAAGGARV
ncbi:hypothetical protein HHI36_004162 [Cryptolaemus montrouzieri]|uniref:Uncharacterized protein n=1 Tax=Cryptolaemus montrouzieri TaxID=559131 RepID=A0ABD2NQM0_9CUCU